MPPSLLAVSVLLLSVPALAQQPPLTADAIMARVAANQDASEAARAHYLYIQHAHIASRRGKTIHCEETTDYRVTPSATGSERQLLKLDGRLLKKGQYIAYTQLSEADKPKATPPEDKPAGDQHAAKSPPPPSARPAPAADNDDVHISIDTDDDDAMDRDLVENLRKNLTATHSKDGISANLFPLTSAQLPGYNFTLLGRELRNGRDSFHIAFTPKDPDDFTWKGDAWIDATAFQPIVVRTTMSRKIPLAVRMLLGTNVPGLGFTIVYAPQPSLDPSATSTTPSSRSEALPSAVPAERAAGTTADLTPLPRNTSLWFPTSFGTEFKIHVLFFFSREIVFNADNRDFQQTHTTAEIHDAPSSP